MRCGVKSNTLTPQLLCSSCLKYSGPNPEHNADLQYYKIQLQYFTGVN